MLGLIPKPCHRVYVALAVGTVALAVGVNLVVFTIVNALWLRPMPIPNADRFVFYADDNLVSLESLILRPFHGAVAGQVDENELGLRPFIALPGRPNLEIAGVTPGFFGLFGVAIRGRDFAPDDDLPGAEPVAIVSHGLWVGEFGRRDDLVGTVIRAGSIGIRVIGVAPPGFGGVRRGDRINIWIPSQLRRRLAPTSLHVWGVPLLVYARLPQGRTLADAEREMRDSDPRGTSHRLVSLTRIFGTPTSPTVVIQDGSAQGVVSGLALLVLIGGCSTLATLILVHYERRSLELATKAALGATRVQLVRELARELAVVAGLSASGAVLVAGLTLRVMPALSLPSGLDLGRLDLSLDWRVLSAAAGATFVTCAVAAWLPLRRVTLSGLASVLSGGPATTASAASQRLRQLLLGAQVCAAVVVLASAALFVRAVLHGFGQAAGIDVGHTLFVRVEVASGFASMNYQSTEYPAMVAQRRRQISEALRGLSGVEQVVNGESPIGPAQILSLERPMLIDLDGRRQALRVGRINNADAEWLSTLGVPMLAGRGLGPGDAEARPMPAVVTASVAERLWPGANPLGQILTTPNRTGRLLIVGVSADFIFGSLLHPASGVIITAWNLDPGISAHWVIRAAHPGAIVANIAKAVKTAVPDVASLTILTGQDVISQDLGRERIGAWFFSGFGLVALMLGIGSVFGLVAYLAESRQREFGLRLALGASTSTLVKHAIRAAVVPVSIGILIGLSLNALIAQLYISTLVGVGALDPLAYSAIAITMLIGATLSALGAAWRLRRVSPMDALRSR